MKKYWSTSQPKHRPQRGLAAIFVTMIMMIVISLVVLGFAEVSRREMRESLDRQLSMQAYLAAETGVNDAVEVIRNASPTDVLEKTSCAYDPTAAYDTSDAVIDADKDIRYTCLLVDTSLPVLRKALAADGTSVAMPLHPNGGSIGTLSLEYTLPDPPASLPCAGSVTGVLNKSTSWSCPYGMIRLDLVPESSYDRAAMTAGQRTVFLYPYLSGATPTHPLAGLDGDIAGMACSATACTARISGFAAGNYYMRAMALYNGGNLAISGNNGAQVIFNDAQAEVDVTGKAQDVLRRIQVRVPIDGSNPPTNYAIESAGSVCKRFGVAPGIFRNTAVPVQDAKNPYCGNISVP